MHWLLLVLMIGILREFPISIYHEPADDFQPFFNTPLEHDNKSTTP